MLATGCLPVILILPISRYLPDGGAIRNLYVDIATECHVPFIDGYDLLARLCDSSFPMEDQFIDSMHLELPVARELADILIQPIVRVWKEASDYGTISLPGSDGVFMDARCFSRGRASMSARTSTLLNADVVEMNASSPVQLDVPEGSHAVAFALDWTRSCGVLRIKGATERTIRLTTVYYRNGQNRFVFGVWPLRESVAAGSTGLTLEVLPDGPADMQCSGGEIMHDPPRVSIAGIVVRSERELFVRKRYLSAIDLGRAPPSGV